MLNEYEIEVIEVNVIDGGIEVFARAWKNGVQLGFGKDGTIDIERFRIFNPPVLVSDPLGEINKDYVNSFTGETIEDRYREDPEEALLQSLTHIIFLVGVTNTDIVVGSRGKTTSTFYPDASVESTSVDGYVGYNNATWATARTTATGNVANDSGTNLEFQTSTSGGQYYIKRTYTLFDTSAIPDTDTIDSATHSVYITGGNNSDAMSLHSVSATPSSNTAITTADYDYTKFGSTSFGSFSIPTSGLNNYFDFTLNASGLANISKTGISYFGLRVSGDLNNTASSAGEKYNQGVISSADAANDPKLVVVHSAGSSFTPTPMIHMMAVSGGIL